MAEGAEHTHGRIVTVPIEEEMKNSYIDYAMSVIVSRALPDVRDGLKPVHRRILYAMREEGMTPDKPYKKSARAVGQVIAKYHPHGDAAVYDAIVRMAQDFTIRYRLVDGHGNFGSLDGDPPAAMRYTEVRLAPLAMELLRDIDKETVDFAPNFDESEKEPVILPARFPNLLVNGSAGIAVGMATNIPPHNLGEVIDGLVALIDDPQTDLDRLTDIIRGPDFPTGALILGRDGVKEAYRTGRGVITMRARAQIETVKGGRTRIVVTEIPYQVNKAGLIERIADLVREKKLEGISDLRDESDRHGVRVVIELRRDENPNVILNRLYKYTQMQQTFGIILLALVDGRPQVLNLREILVHYLDYQKEVITRRTRFELARAEARAHILEGLRVALAHLDEVIRLIRSSKDPDTARRGLMERFGLSEKQAQAILDMRLQRLTALERDKIEAEYNELTRTIEYLRAVLGSERMVMQIVRRELLEVKEKYADERRTQILSGAVGDDFDVEDLIAEEDVVVTMTHRGYVKRLPAATYRSQRRGGRGVAGMGTREEDFVERLFVTTTHHHLLFFSNRGRVYRIKTHQIPEAGRTARGTAVINLVPLERGETITAVIPVKELDSGAYLMMATRRGTVKRTGLSEFATARTSGLIALALDEGDELIGVRLSSPGEEVILATRLGKAIRFPVEDVRPMGRPARGVKGITLDGDDVVESMDTVREGCEVLTLTTAGFGKRTPVGEYPTQSRGGKGVINIRLTEKSGQVVGVRLVYPGDEIMIVSARGVVIRVPVDDIRVSGRNTRGVAVMRLDEGDHVVSFGRVVTRHDE
ncbi:MAG TPA: DNA gyrase subunit A [Clostridiales bacterium]|nr:DNA gyrase subunit A [Clostridiales bacterium]